MSIQSRNSSEFRTAGKELAAGRGFTLVELLALVMLLTFLLVLIFPTITRGRQRALQTTCQANLKQIGFALQGYANANADFLPGPVLELAEANYNLSSSNELSWFIAERLGRPYPSRQEASTPQLLCPARASERRPSQAGGQADYALNDGRALNSPPFGRPGTPALPSLKLSSIAATATLANCYAVADADKGNVSARVPGWKALPYSPIHGKVRNQLYFDWHIASKGW